MTCKCIYTPKITKQNMKKRGICKETILDWMSRLYIASEKKQAASKKVFLFSDTFHKVRCASIVISIHPVSPSSLISLSGLSYWSVFSQHKSRFHDDRSFLGCVGDRCRRLLISLKPSNSTNGKSTQKNHLRFIKCIMKYLITFLNVGVTLRSSTYRPFGSVQNLKGV